jgi:hypothetical protein
MAREERVLKANAIDKLFGVDLRTKYFELLGWHREEYRGGTVIAWWKERPPKNTPDNFVAYGDDYLPAVESDPSISERELDKLCKNEGWEWEVGTRVRRFNEYRVYDGIRRPLCYCRILDEDFEEIARAEALTTSEARLKAMCKALMTK